MLILDEDEFGMVTILNVENGSRLLIDRESASLLATMLADEYGEF